MWHLTGSAPVLYPSGLVLGAAAAGGLILAAAAPGRIGALLSWKPLRWLGIRSYGVYLWHWPVIAITTGLAPRSATSLLCRVIDTALPIALAAASWRWLEEPILRNGFRSEVAHKGRLLLLGAREFRTNPTAAFPVVVAVVVLTAACAAGYGILNPPRRPTLQAQIATGARLSVTTLPTAQPSGEPTPWWHIPGRLPFRTRVHVKPTKPEQEPVM